MTFDPSAFRGQFPIFQQPENRQWIYLDSAATSQKPAQVIDAIADYYRTANANAHRASHRLGRKSTEIIEAARAAQARFVGAHSAAEVIFTRGATESLNLLAQSLGAQLQAGDEILLTQAEHHANLVPWQMLAQRTGVQLRFLPSDNGVPEFDQLSQWLNPRTKIFSCCAVSNVLGFRAPLATIREQLAGSGVTWIVDAAQLLAHGPVDVQAIGCDFLVGSAHKFYGPSGIGLLWGRGELLTGLAPWQGGGQMVAQVTQQESQYQAGPLKFEAGTPSLAAIAGLLATLAFWQQQDVVGLHDYEQQLLQRLYAGLASLPNVYILSPRVDNVGIVSFWLSGVDADALALLLDQQDIAVRTGHHCATPLLASLNLSHCLRISLCAYNTPAEVDRLLQALAESLALLADADQAPVDSRPAIAVESSGRVLVDLNPCDLAQLRAAGGWQNRYRMLLRWSKQLPEQPWLRSEALQVEGCEAATWLWAECVDGQCRFYIDSEANVVKGLAVLLLLHIQGQPAVWIQQWDIDALFNELQLQRHLSPSRVNGFYALWQAVLGWVNRFEESD
ncbi:aminotransferase class V-fold PLP-dependent enzyme [Halioxenophilus sp. WMMB6]|uniref:aminotransferase class V-fold PLP-dependent enzyme n=1 Tax=Halioxenophilus sp. WMMB6 TaxID=3073815 RepID=UPI00295F3506|nr:aminotransferase class V-fold PLP-dependent enzyme [Halioxenophilus sp. WMMB6]